MHTLALIVALAAIGVFAYDYAKTKSLIAIGLAAVTTAVILQFVLTTGSTVTIG